MCARERQRGGIMALSMLIAVGATASIVADTVVAVGVNAAAFAAAVPAATLAVIMEDEVRASPYAHHEHCRRHRRAMHAPLELCLTPVARSVPPPHAHQSEPESAGADAIEKPDGTAPAASAAPATSTPNPPRIGVALVLDRALYIAGAMVGASEAVYGALMSADGGCASTPEPESKPDREPTVRKRTLSRVRAPAIAGGLSVHAIGVCTGRRGRRKVCFRLLLGKKATRRLLSHLHPSAPELPREREAERQEDAERARIEERMRRDEGAKAAWRARRERERQRCERDRARDREWQRENMEHERAMAERRERHEEKMAERRERHEKVMQRSKEASQRLEEVMQQANEASQQHEEVMQRHEEKMAERRELHQREMAERRERHEEVMQRSKEASQRFEEVMQRLKQRKREMAREERRQQCETEREMARKAKD